MKVLRTVKLIGGALIAVVSLNAWSQSSDAAAASAPTSAAPMSHHATAKASRKANRALGRKVLYALSKGGVPTTGINAVAKNGAVVLEGDVTDATLIQKAGDIANGVPGVKSVKNDLTVKEIGQ
jgi:hyperosmotically inducible protein